MKKRLLSAALALAMVLTMLPLTAFADDPKAVDVTYFTATDSEKGITTANKWYTYDSTSKQYSEASSIKVLNKTGLGAPSNKATAKALTSVAEAVELKWTSMTLLDDGELDISTVKSTGTLSIDTAGHTLTISGCDSSAVGQTFSTLTLTSSAKESGKVAPGKVTGKIDVTGSLTLNLTNVGKDSKALEVALTNSEAKSAKKLTVKLTDSEVGAITTTNAALSLTVTASTKGAAKAGAVTVNENIAEDLSIDPGQSSISVAGGEVESITLNGDTPTNGIVFSSLGSCGAITLNGGAKYGTDKKSPKWMGNIYVTVNSGCEVESIAEADDGTDGVITVKVSGTVTGSIDLSKSNTKHSVNVDGGAVGAGAKGAADGDGGSTAALTMNAGTLTIQNNATVGAVTLGSDGKGGDLTVNVSGSKTTVAGMSVAGDVNPTVNISSGSITGELQLDLASKKYTKKTITGGSFATQLSAHPAWLKSATYEISGKVNGKTMYTYTNSFQDCVDAYKNNSTENPVTITLVGAAKGAKNVASFYMGDENLVVKITSDEKIPVVLPSSVNGKTVSTWYVGDEKSPKDAGAPVIISGEDVEIKTTVGTEDNSQIVGVSVPDEKNTGNEGLSASLSGNTIKVSGALREEAVAGEPIVLTVKTALNKDGYEVTVAYYPELNGKKNQLLFVSAENTPVQEGRASGTIMLKGNTTVYTLDGSGLSINAGVTPASAVGTTVASTSLSLGTADKDALLTAAKGVTATVLKDDPAIVEAINKEIAKLSQSNVATYIKNAKIAQWRKDNNKTTTPKDDELTGYSDYKALEAVVYLNVVVKAWNRQAGAQSMTLGITPYIKYQVTGGSNPTAIDVPNTAKALPLSGVTAEFGEVEITVPDNLIPAGWAHHGDYVYEISGNKFKNPHGFSDFVLNSVGPKAEVWEKGVAPGASGKSAKMLYDDVQTAIDEAEEGETVKLCDNYGKTSETFVVSGKARTITFNPGNNGTFVPTFSGANVTADKTNGNVWTVQLNVDTAPTSARITVATASNGSASVSASTAVPGATVSGTIKPNTGYKAGAFTATAKTATGNVSVSVSVDADKNTFSFVVPAGATSVSVTPAFVSANQATIRVGSATGGYAVTNVADGDAAAHGSTVTVTTVPNSGYRTIGATARTNSGATVAVTRNGLNSFSFVVPTTATAVTVTPSFDLDNNTPFSDVLSSRWSSDDVAWIYNKGYTTGYGNMYTFAPTVECTRWEMVTFLWKAAGYKQVNIANPFQDVSATYPNAQAYQAIMWAVSQGLVDTSTGYFYPTNKISRAAAVEILYKQAGSPPASTSNGFKDVPTTASYAKAVSWAEANGITNGKDNRDTFKPNDTITRQEIAKMLHVAFG